MADSVPSIQILPPSEEPSANYTDEDFFSGFPAQWFETSSALFATSSSGQLPPALEGLKDGCSQGGLSTLAELNLESSPQASWSPLSTSSGEVFPDNFSDWTSSAPPSHPSSPHMSLLESFDDFGLEESFETQTLSFDRPRSLSHSMGQSDAFHPGLDTRPRSSSFNDASQLRLNIFEGSFSYNPSEPQSAPLSPLSPSVDFTGMESSVPSSPQNLSPQSPFAPHRRSLSLGGDESLDQQSQNTQLQHGDFLTVPKLSAPLQRHNATHGHRRNQTHSGHFEGMGRGRSLSPVPIGLGVPIDTNSRNWSPRSPSSQSSASSSYSPSPISPASPFNDDNYHEFQSEASVFSPDDTGLARRHSFGSNSSFEGHSDLGVHRTRSDPYPRPKSRTPSRSARGSQTDLVFKNQWPESMARYHQDGSSSQLDLHASEAGSSYGDDDGGSPVTLASDKIIAASNKRRKHQARFSCDICGQNFTARHNLQNHLNAHDGVKNFACKFCDFRAVTAAVATRHETNACKSNPGRVQVKKRS